MDLQQLLKSAETVKNEYAALHERTGRPQWSATEYAEGFVGDVGDLMKLVMVRDGYREIENAESRSVHELCDCLWSVLILAQEFEIDMEKEFPAQMESILSRIRASNS